jgi:hypothetical protein
VFESYVFDVKMRPLFNFKRTIHHSQLASHENCIGDTRENQQARKGDAENVEPIPVYINRRDDYSIVVVLLSYWASFPLGVWGGCWIWVRKRRIAGWTLLGAAITLDSLAMLAIYFDALPWTWNWAWLWRWACAA